jgi:predicted nucleotidyltransferase
MPLPNRSIRIDPSHTDLLNSVLSLLRSGRADELRQALAAAEQGLAPVGPFINDRTALDFLLGRLVLAAKPEAIWLFGSRAGDSGRPNSDFDFLVVFSDDKAGDLDVLRDRLADAVLGYGVGVDIAVCTNEEFEAYGSVAGSLIRTVREQGRPLYSRQRPRAQETSTT